jgi:hypothetical protein
MIATMPSKPRSRRWLCQLRNYWIDALARNIRQYGPDSNGARYAQRKLDDVINQLAEGRG